MIPHEGYEYQDCLCAYYILKEILEDSACIFKIDLKENGIDKFDDLTIITESNVSKKQIKYSNPTSNHSLSKSDISSAKYDLAIDTLFKSWQSSNKSIHTEFRLCLAWDEPTDELKDLLLEDKSIKPSFNSYETKSLTIDIEKLWPAYKEPLSSWRRLREVSNKISREDFKEFCNQLVIEVNFPKFSLDIYNPDELEKILLEQVRVLGVGEYPNDNLSGKDALLNLFYLIRQCRSKGRQINTNDVLQYLRIRTDYGEIRQIFPVDETLNIKTENIINEIIDNFSDSNQILLIGEPGSGKSWAVENFTRVLKNKGEKVVNYYCYTSLEDELQKDRIKTNTLYGSLLAEIIKIFPDLKKYKNLKYASNFNELNLILDKIDEEVYLIIDGLDHINRVYERYRNELSENEVDILIKISKLKFNNRIKILLVSQPIKELNILINFKNYQIPNWNGLQIIEYLEKHNIHDIEINNVNLSSHLLNKSAGNPLYLTYIVEELKSRKTIQERDITNLPSYSYNLKNYYTYLLSKSELHQDIPRILAGASFRLNKEEIKQITKMGDIVDSSLEILNPILKSNYVKHGYAIYHESFRRYIIDYLKQNNIPVIEKVYNPLIKWLEEKGFYLNYRSYRYYFPLLLECDITKKILKYLTSDFLIQSVAHGYSWQLIKNNLRYLLYACVKEKDFPSIVLLNELKHTLLSTENEFEGSFENYFDALGYLVGFDQAVNYLSFEDKGTLSYTLGIQACYICDIHGIAPPWDLYIDYIENNGGIKLEDFKFIVRYNFSNDPDNLVRILNDLNDDNRDDYLQVFKNEFEKYNDNDRKDEIFQDETIQYILNKNDETELNFEELTTLIIGINFISENELLILKQFFICIEKNIHNGEGGILDYLFDQLKTRNWFYNWIIYYIKILQNKYKPAYSFTELKEAFQYLLYDTEPFKGKPRTCDLFKAEGYIHDTLIEGLSYLNTKEEWDEILDILFQVSNNTTTSFQKTLGGPLSTNDFLSLLEKIVNINNSDKVISLFEKIIKIEKEHNLYSYIAEYNFRLSKLYSKVSNKAAAKLLFINGSKYLLSYTFRKDTTLDELMESIQGISSLDKDLGDEYIKKIKILADTVINHTDGKGTKHFPISWFSKYLEINFSASLLFLLNSLSNTRYDWRLDECLVDLLNKSRGSINPLLELFMTKTLPIENSNEFLSTSIYLTEKIEKNHPLLARNSYGQILTKYEIENNTSDNKNEGIYEQLKVKLKNCGVATIKPETFPKGTQTENNFNYDVPPKPLIEIVNALIKPEPISDLDPDELAIYLAHSEVNDRIINSLIHYFETKTELTEELKGIIKLLSLKDKWSRGQLNNKLKIIFSCNPSFNQYFSICRYTFEKGGWDESFVNQDTFLESYRTDPNLSIDFLFELLNEVLNSSDYNRLLSANLINTLIKIGFDKKIIIKAWENLFNIIDSRLPDQEPFDWNNALSDEFNMSDEERLISILFTRLKINTTERHHYSILGILLLLRQDPNKFIKPFKWFFKNFNNYLEITQLFLLELLWSEGEEIHKYLDVELNNIYPTNNFSIDYLLELIAKLPERKSLVIPTKLIYPKDYEANDFYKSVNKRFEILEEMGFDLSNVFGEFLNSFSRYYGKYFELTYNRVHKRNVNIIYNPNYFLKLINTNFYLEFRNSKSPSLIELFSVLKIEYRTLLAQHSSIFYRPQDLDKPSKINTDFFKQQELSTNSGWIRLGHFERELMADSYASEFKESRCFGGIVFNDNIENGLPYSKYRLNPSYIWHPELCNYENEDYIICSFLQLEEFFEYYKIIWLNPVLVKKLNLVTDEFLNGLSAKNETGEIILIYNSWYSDYVGNESIYEEIPKLDGCELLIREDYFQKILNIYKNKTPYYYLLKI